MTSTIVEYLQGIQTAKEPTAPDKNRSGNLAIKYEHFTRTNDIYIICNICLNTLWR
jgi:hypothetical protein